MRSVLIKSNVEKVNNDDFDDCDDHDQDDGDKSVFTIDMK